MFGLFRYRTTKRAPTLNLQIRRTNRPAKKIVPKRDATMKDIGARRKEETTDQKQVKKTTPKQQRGIMFPKGEKNKAKITTSSGEDWSSTTAPSP